MSVRNYLLLFALCVPALASTITTANVLTYAQGGPSCTAQSTGAQIQCSSAATSPYPGSSGAMASSSFSAGLAQVSVSGFANGQTGYTASSSVFEDDSVILNTASPFITGNYSISFSSNEPSFVTPVITLGQGTVTQQIPTSFFVGPSQATYSFTTPFQPGTAMEQTIRLSAYVNSPSDLYLNASISFLGFFDQSGKTVAMEVPAAQLQFAPIATPEPRTLWLAGLGVLFALARSNNAPAALPKSNRRKALPPAPAAQDDLIAIL
jgi:hypothetical protein